MLLFIFYTPTNSVEQVKEAVFQAGAGKIGNYDSCSWMTLGQGQFKPLKDSNPYIGEQDKITLVDEYKVEMICREEVVTDVINALKNAHPYEEPAYHFIKIE